MSFRRKYETYLERFEYLLTSKRNEFYQKKAELPLGNAAFFYYQMSTINSQPKYLFN
jgi:hypothetical protein